MASLLDGNGNYSPPLAPAGTPNAAVGGATGLSGSIAPEGVVDGTFGNTYTRTTNGAFYIKTSASGNTGWVLNS